jgi:hypothetical protein
VDAVGRHEERGRGADLCYRCDRAIVFRIETHAKRREAKVYAELLGYGVSSDAEHISEPDPTGQHPARAMKMAFADAGINPEEIDYINAHGTSTPLLGDASETRVINRAGCGVHYRRFSSGGPSRVVRSPRAGADVVDIRTYCTGVSLV